MNAVLHGQGYRSSLKELSDTRRVRRGGIVRISRTQAGVAGADMAVRTRHRGHVGNRSAGDLAPEDLPGEHPLLNLVRTFVDLTDLAVAIERLYRALGIVRAE